LGVYGGTLTFKGAPNKAGQVTIAMGAEVALNLTVGEGIYRDFKVAFVKPLDIEEGWSPRAYLKINNNGNVAESLDYGTFEVLDQYGGARLAYLQKNKGFPEVPPFYTGEYSVEFPTGFSMGMGQYWGVVNFFQENKLLGSQKTPFNVLKAGSLSTPWAYAWRFLVNYQLIIYAGVVLLLVVAVALYLRKRSRRIRQSA
jgi:hypothetical protein